MEKFSFFNSVNGDRKYQATDFANYFNKFITNGVFPNVASNLQVIANGDSMQIKLKAGAAWIKGFMYENTYDLNLNIDIADGLLNRIDRVVIWLDYLNRDMKAVVKKGAFATNPVAPELQRNVDMFELGIADIRVNKGITSITQSNVTDLRLNTQLCGMVNSLAQADTTAIFHQYQDWFNNVSIMHEDEFQQWFDTIKGQLTGDVAANLANQINVVEQKANSNTDKIDVLSGQGEVKEKADKDEFNEHLATYSQFKDELSGLGKIYKYLQTTEITTATNRIKITISEYDIETDLILVFQNKIYLQQGNDYSISIDSQGVWIEKELDEWEVPTTIQVLVMKSADTVTEYKDGRLLRDSSVSIEKLDEPLKSKLNAIYNSAKIISNSTPPSDANEGDIWYEI